MKSDTNELSIRQYKSLLSNLNSLNYYLDGAYKRITDCNQLDSSYVINEITIGDNLLSKSKDDIFDIKSKIDNEIIPWLEMKIRKLEEDI